MIMCQYPLPQREGVVSPFMVRQAHHERTMDIKNKLVSRSP
jgi:hypothetical protein